MDECRCARDDDGNLANHGYGDPNCWLHPPVPHAAFYYDGNTYPQELLDH
jgi:hypothetical protein